MLISKDGVTYALLARTSERFEASRFLTPAEEALQVGAFARPAGFVEAAHAHVPRTAAVESFAQVLVLTEGRVRLRFYEPDGRLFRTEELAAGDLAVFLDGAHGLEVLEAARGWSVKQGPYRGERADKAFLPRAL